MDNLPDADRPKRTTAGRIGFWLGLVLFVGMLMAPTPESMRRVARSDWPSRVGADGQHGGQAAQSNLGDPPSALSAVAQSVVEGRSRKMLAAAAVTVLMACWWITVAVPIPVTSLMPLILFPLVGVLPIPTTWKLSLGLFERVWASWALGISTGSSFSRFSSKCSVRSVSSSTP